MTETELIAICVAVVLVVALVLNRNLSGKLGQMSVTLGHINKATNDRQEGEPTMSRQVAELARDVKDHRREFAELTGELVTRVDGLESAVKSLAGRVTVLEHPTPEEAPS